MRNHIKNSPIEYEKFINNNVPIYTPPPNFSWDLSAPIESISSKGATEAHYARMRGALHFYNYQNSDYPDLPQAEQRKKIIVRNLPRTVKELISVGNLAAACDLADLAEGLKDSDKMGRMVAALHVTCAQEALRQAKEAQDKAGKTQGLVVANWQAERAFRVNEELSKHPLRREITSVLFTLQSQAMDVRRDLAANASYLLSRPERKSFVIGNQLRNSDRQLAKS